MRKLVCGVGVNDADYVIQNKLLVGYVNGRRKEKLVRICPFYRAWSSMLTRCSSEKYKERNPTYEDVTCCEEWLLFSNFKRWMEQQDWKGKQLDKDIIVSGNKMYSPETCAFVNKMTNLFTNAWGIKFEERLLGVSYDLVNDKFKATCSNPFYKRHENLGRFSTPEEAHEAWRKRKHELAQLVAETESDPRVVEALKKRYSKEEWYK